MHRDRLAAPEARGKVLIGDFCREMQAVQPPDARPPPVRRLFVDAEMGGEWGETRATVALQRGVFAQSKNEAQ